MNRSLLIVPLVLSTALFSLPVLAQSGTCQPLEPFLEAGARALPGREAPGSGAFAAFRGTAAESARAAGAGEVAGSLALLAPGRPVAEADYALASCLLRAYVQARYGADMVRDLQEMVGFRTYLLEEGKSNWDAPEFVRQREWLRRRAEGLGLEFRSFDGRVEEVTLPGSGPILALLTHGDVQDVAGQLWSSPPWEGRRVGERIVGRGTEDDKGPIVAGLYALAALRDAGWPLGKTLRLLVANAEESSWEEIPYYLERAPMPAMTIGVDASYPVTHAQKAYGVLTFRSSRPAKAPAPGRYRVVKIEGGSGMSIIPERGFALLDPARDPAEALPELSGLAGRWAAEHPPARLAVTREGEHLKVAAEGKGGHSSVPESGHNALADLASFLATLDLTRDAWGALALFTAEVIGQGTDGRGLGIAHDHQVMGPLTASLSFLHELEGVPAAQINTRHPRGITNEEITRRITERAADFDRRTGAAVAVESLFFNEPHLVPVEGELVSGLLAVWAEVTGTPGKPIAIGGGTQARLFQGGVDFGPASGMEVYRGHGPDEYLTVGELHRIAELTVAALWKLGR